MNEAVRLVPIRAIQVVEVYEAAIRIPPEYMSDACAAILVWTK